jgi:hypothetical protein
MGMKSMDVKEGAVLLPDYRKCSAVIQVNIGPNQSMILISPNQDYGYGRYNKQEE